MLGAAEAENCPAGAAETSAEKDRAPSKRNEERLEVMSMIGKSTGRSDASSGR